MTLRSLLRWRWAILVAGLLVAGLVFAFWPQPTTVDVTRVSKGPLEIGVTDDGVTRAEEFYVVAAPVSGYLSRIELEPGDPVARGGLITTIGSRPAAPLDPRANAELRAALAAARAAQGSASASLSQARRDLARSQALADRGFLPRAQLEAARTRVLTAEAAVAQARAEALRISAELTPPAGRGNAAAVPVRAPVAGTILSVITESEGAVAEGTTLVTIGDPRRIEVVVDLLSRQAVRVKPGDRVKITEWGGSAPLTGTVRRIEPFGRLKVSALGIEEQRVNVVIGFDEASLGAAARLGHGYQIDATIVVWSRPDAVRLPIGALVRGKDGQWQVFTATGGRAVLRPVRIGQINDEWAEVLAGLAPGDQVIATPSPSLTDNTRIKPRAASQ